MGSEPAVQTEAFAGDAGEWDGFVRDAASATFFHLFGWRTVLEQSFGFRPHYLAARRAGRLVGVLPLCEVRSGFGRSCLLSLPFAVEAGPCTSDDTARRALDEAAVKVAAVCGARYVELRDGVRAQGFDLREGQYYRFRRTLHSTDEENLAAIPRKRRRMIRVGEKHGLVAHHEQGLDRLEAFYDLHARSLRRLGTPVFPREYFRNLLQIFPEACLLSVVSSGTTPVAAVLSFVFGRTVMPYYAGSRGEYFGQAVNDFLYWELMRYACARGLQTFDFGRSKKGSGAYAYKRHWGFEAEPLRYRVKAVSGDRLRLQTADAGGLRLLREGWRRLPLPVTKLLGPGLVRRFGAFYT